MGLPSALGLQSAPAERQHSYAPAHLAPRAGPIAPVYDSQFARAVHFFPAARPQTRAHMLPVPLSSVLPSFHLFQNGAAHSAALFSYPNHQLNLSFACFTRGCTEYCKRDFKLLPPLFDADELPESRLSSACSFASLFSLRSASSAACLRICSSFCFSSSVFPVPPLPPLPPLIPNYFPEERALSRVSSTPAWFGKRFSACSHISAHSRNFPAFR